MILLTSFIESRRLLKRSAFQRESVDCYSVSRFQPAGFDYPVLPFLGAKDKHGVKLSLRGEKYAVHKYKHKLYEAYSENWSEIDEWLQELDNDQTVFLCCWCPFAEHSRRQLDQFKSFVCHTGLIGRIINIHRPDIDLYMDLDHHNSLATTCRPHTHKALIL